MKFECGIIFVTLIVYSSLNIQVQTTLLNSSDEHYITLGDCS